MMRRYGREPILPHHAAILFCWGIGYCLPAMAVADTFRRTLRRTGDLIVRLSPLPHPSHGAQTRAVVLFRVVAELVGLGVLVGMLRFAFKPMFNTPPPAPLVVHGPGDKYLELDEPTRKEIFHQLAELEQRVRKEGIEKNTWNGHIWSREDDRGWGERVLARSLAQKYGISLTQVFLVLDEGIRKKWPGPDGNPLPATVPPLDLRPTW